MSWRCPNCGYEPIPDDLDTCPQCGYIIQMKSEAERESVEKVMEKEVETKERMKEIPVEKEAASIEVTEEKELPTEEKVFKLTVISSAIPEFKGKTFETSSQLLLLAEDLKMFFQYLIPTFHGSI